MKALLIPLATVVVTAALTFFAARYWHSRNLRDKATTDTNDRIVDLERKHAETVATLAALEANVQPISEAFMAMLIKQLTHFHTPELDTLLEKAEVGSLTADEARQLKAFLEKRVLELNGEIDESEREAAIMLPMIMRRVEEERSYTEGDLKMVVVPPAHE